MVRLNLVQHDHVEHTQNGYVEHVRNDYVEHNQTDHFERVHNGKVELCPPE